MAPCVTKDPASRSDMVGEAGFRVLSGRPDRCLVGISLILLDRAWSKLDERIVVVGLEILLRHGVEGSNPSALTDFKDYSSAV
jgi:hypothetical protein